MPDLIGDPALQVDRSRYLTLDLAEEWIRYTGKPFVFAFWAVRQDALRETESSLHLPAVRVAKRRSGTRARLSSNISTIPRPRPQADEQRVGSQTRHQ
jgi:predicted solute-binding protein